MLGGSLVKAWFSESVRPEFEPQHLTVDKKREDSYFSHLQNGDDNAYFLSFPLFRWEHLWSVQHRTLREQAFSKRLRSTPVSLHAAMAGAKERKKLTNTRFIK